MTIYDLCVVGAGMVGSAAARHASKDSTAKVCLVGPSEPHTRSFDDHRDIYGSHYDEGRLTCSFDADPVWATMAQESIKRYREIEKESGVPFYNEVGSLMIRSENSDHIHDLKKNAKKQGVSGAELNHAELVKMVPYLNTAEDDIAIYEERSAGYISPRRLVEAQKIVSRKQGCTIIDDVVRSVERVVQQDRGYIMRVTTEGKRQVLSKAVLLATGAFTNFRQLLPAGVKPDQQLRGLTVALVEVDKDYKTKRRSMPVVIYKGAGHPDRHRFPQGGNSPVDFYLLPPILYPDGRDYIKLGYYHADLRVFLTSVDDVKDWFVNGNKDRAEHTTKFVQSLFTDLKIKSWHGDFCVMTETPTGRPYIDKIHAQLGVAIGGNSRAAKSSDEIGRLAANMMFGRWDSTIPPDLFKLRISKDTSQRQSNSKL